MAIIFADGFDHYGTGATGLANMRRGVYTMHSSSLYAQPSTAQSRTGGTSLYITIDGYAQYNLKSALRVLGVALAINFLSAPSGRTTGIAVRDGSNNNICTIGINPDGALSIHKGNISTTAIAVSAPGVLQPGAFNHIEIKFIVDNVAGGAEIRVNGVTVLVLSNYDIGNTDIRSVIFGKVYVASAAPMYYDDFVLWDDTGVVNNDFIGQQRVLTVFPSSDTEQADFGIVGSATGYGAISDSAPDDDATYITTVVDGDISEFGLPELPSDVAEIRAVHVVNMSRLETAGLGTLQLSMVSDSAVASGDDHALTPSYLYRDDTFNVDPATGTAWNKASVEAAKLKIEKIG